MRLLLVGALAALAGALPTDYHPPSWRERDEARARKRDEARAEAKASHSYWALLAAGDYTINGDAYALGEFSLNNGELIAMGDVGKVIGPCTVEGDPNRVVRVDFGEGKQICANGKSDIESLRAKKTREAEEAEALLAAGDWTVRDRVASLVEWSHEDGEIIVAMGDVGKVIGPCIDEDDPDSVVFVDFGEGKRICVNGKTHIESLAEREAEEAEFLQSFTRVWNSGDGKTLADEGVKHLELPRTVVTEDNDGNTVYKFSHERIRDPVLGTVALHAKAPAPASTLNAVFLLPEKDDSGVFDLKRPVVSRILKFLKHYNVWIFRVESIQHAKDVLKRVDEEAKIDHLDIGGHGHKDHLTFGEGVGGMLIAGADETRKFFEWLSLGDTTRPEFFKWLSLGDKGAPLWGPLAPSATIMLDSCLAGGWTIKDGVVATDSLLTFAAPHVCDHEITGSVISMTNDQRFDYFDEVSGRWTGVIDEGGRGDANDLKTSRTSVSCAQGFKGTMKAGATSKAYNGAFKAHRGKWCPLASYYETTQKVWVAGDHSMVDRCALACDLAPECTAFTFVERSAASRDLKVIHIHTSSGKKYEEEAQCHLSENCAELSPPDDVVPWEGRVFTTFVKTEKGLNARDKAKRVAEQEDKVGRKLREKRRAESKRSPQSDAFWMFQEPE